MEDFSSAGQGIVLTEQPGIGGDFIAYEASSPVGPWTQKLSGQVPCGNGTSFCRAIIGHPKLSTTSQLVLSYFDPGQPPLDQNGNPVGHIMADAFPW